MYLWRWECSGGDGGRVGGAGGGEEVLNSDRSS